MRLTLRVVTDKSCQSSLGIYRCKIITFIRSLKNTNEFGKTLCNHFDGAYASQILSSVLYTLDYTDMYVPYDLYQYTTQVVKFLIIYNSH